MGEQSASLLDLHFASFLGARSGLAGEDKKHFTALVQKVSASLEAGHSCLPVGKLDELLLRRVHLVSGGDMTPLVLEHGNLYLHRYYSYEKRLARALVELASVRYGSQKGENSTSTDKPGRGNSDQDMAVELAANNGLAVICGGPGTGKTTTVVNILARLLSSYGTQLKIGLAAPTGKAAMRLAEAVSGNLQRFVQEPWLLEALPKTAQTLHRLLGYRSGSARFAHNRENPMIWDVVVVDESSMVDLAMMAKLVEAIKPGARLILLGDRDQLASVESGSVLSDIMNSLPQNSIELKKTYRFDHNIKRLADHIKAGDGDSAWSVLGDPRVDNISCLDDDLYNFIGKKYENYMRLAYDWQQHGGEAVFQEFNRFQVLCAVHFGDLGVEGINRRVEIHLNRAGFECPPDRWYLGRPLIIMQNDYSLELFNGDIGICLPDTADGSPAVYFFQPGGGLKSYNFHLLPPYQTVFAMTVHKSQGSEFEQVVVVLPKDDNRVLCKELIYTGVTRAKKEVTIAAVQKVFTNALSRNIKRNSGLSQMLKTNLQSR